MNGLDKHCVKSVPIRSYFWSVFSCIRPKYEDLLRKSPYAVRIQEIRTRKNSVFGLFSRSESALLIGVWRSCFTTDLKFNHVISKRFSIYTLKSCGNPHSCYSVSIYLFKVNNGNTRKMREIQVSRFQHLNGNETEMPDETGSGNLLWK